MSKITFQDNLDIVPIASNRAPTQSSQALQSEADNSTNCSSSCKSCDKCRRRKILKKTFLILILFIIITIPYSKKLIENMIASKLNISNYILLYLISTFLIFIIILAILYY